MNFSKMKKLLIIVKFDFNEKWNILMEENSLDIKKSHLGNIIKINKNEFLILYLFIIEIDLI
jgi:hypothetical protein